MSKRKSLPMMATLQYPIFLCHDKPISIVGLRYKYHYGCYLPLLFCFLAIVITGVVTFFITKERFTEKHYTPSDSRVYSNSNVCDSNPCQNEGICSVVRDSYSCKCPEGYAGQQCQDIGYSNYVIMFAEPAMSYDTSRLYMHSSRTGTVHNTAERTRTFGLSSGINQVHFPRSLFTKDGISNKAIHVNSTVPIVLYKFVGDTAVDGYLAIPSAMLGDKYIVPTFRPFEHKDIRTCLIDVFSLTANTQIQEKLKIPSIGTKVNYNHRSYANEETITVNLSEFQTFQISHIYDLSGSVIISNKPIGVMSGNRCNSINHVKCNTFIEMVLPVNQLDQLYITPTIAIRNDSVIRVYCHEATKLQISTVTNEYVVNVEKEHFYEFNSSHLALINASDSVLVVSFPMDFLLYDAYMMTISGIKHYRSSYNFIVPVGFTSYISVTYLVTNMKSRYDPLDGFKIDNRKLNLTDVFKKTINERMLETFRHDIEDGAHEIRHDLHMKFGLCIYGDDHYEGYGFPGGMAYSSQP